MLATALMIYELKTQIKIRVLLLTDTWGAFIPDVLKGVTGQSNWESLSKFVLLTQEVNRAVEVSKKLPSLSFLKRVGG